MRLSDIHVFGDLRGRRLGGHRVNFLERAAVVGRVVLAHTWQLYLEMLTDLLYRGLPGKGGIQSF